MGVVERTMMWAELKEKSNTIILNKLIFRNEVTIR